MSEPEIGTPPADAALTRCLGCMDQTSPDPVCPSCGWDARAAAASVLHLQPATTLETRYVIGRVLGQGGFGITYLAWDSAEQRKVAVKEYFPQAIASRSPGTSQVISVSERVRDDFNYGLQRFTEEAQVLALFRDHPCVVSVLDFLETQGTGYLVMEYLEGMTLKDFLASKGERLPYDLTMKIMHPVMDALRDVHAHRVLHRDVSPDNILLTTSRIVKLLDFGAARFAVSERSQSLSVILKPGYAPEEQYRQRGQQGPWTDVYATAATIYRCVTGAPPPEALDRMAEETLRTPREAGFNVPPHADKALRRALAIRATERFSSMLDFQRAIQAGDGTSYLPGPVAGLTDPGPDLGRGLDRGPRTVAFPVEGRTTAGLPAGISRLIRSTRARLSTRTGIGVAAAVVALAAVSGQVYMKHQRKAHEETDQSSPAVKNLPVHPPALPVSPAAPGGGGSAGTTGHGNQTSPPAGQQPEADRAQEARRAREAKIEADAAAADEHDRMERERIAREQQQQADAERAREEELAAERARAEKEEALNPDWHLFANNAFSGANKIQESDGYLRIMPGRGGGVEANLPIRINRRGQQEIMGPWDNPAKAARGFLVIQEKTERRISGYMLVPMPWVTDRNACMNRTTAIFQAFADGLAQRQNSCRRINVVWMRQ